MSQTLVLNATYEPLGVVSERRALILVLNERATSVEDSSRILTYARGSITLPAVIKLNKFISLNLFNFNLKKYIMLKLI